MRNPTQCSFDHPSARDDAEPTSAWLSRNDFEIPATFRLAPSSQLLSTVRRIGPDLFETWVQWSKSSEQAPNSFPIVQISGSDIHSQEKAKRIHEDMAFTSLHALVCIEATDPDRFRNGLDTLRIHDRCARLFIPPDPLPFSFPQKSSSFFHFRGSFRE